MIVNDEQRATMEFIATVNRGGCRPTGEEVNEWRLAPDPMPLRRGELLEPEIPAVGERRVRKGPSGFNAMGSVPQIPTVFRPTAFRPTSLSDAVRQNFTALNSPSMRGIMKAARFAGPQVVYETIPGKPGRPAKYGPDLPAEEFLACLCRLGWIERDDGGRYGVTLLGHALLRAEASADSGAEESSVMVLDAGDEFAYGRVLGVIADCGEALIVDGWLGVQELGHILLDSNAARFLVSTSLPADRRAALAVQVRLSAPNRDGVVRELRLADFHDRYLIGDHEVYGLGSSLNGIGKSLTTLIKMPDSAATAIRADVKNLWESATIVAWTGQLLETDERDKDGKGSASTHRVVKAPDGSFRHTGCDVKHRSQQVAEKCKNGR